MTRYPDWESRLYDFFEEMRDVPHAYGSNDCGLFGASAVLAITGIDPAAHIRGTYSTEIGCAKMLLPYGGLFEFVDMLLPRDDLAMCRRGDLVGMNGERGPFIAVAWGTMAVSVNDSGTVQIPMDQAVARWRID